MLIKFRASIDIRSYRVKTVQGKYIEMHDGDIADIAEPFARDRLNRFPSNFERVQKAILGRPANKMINPPLENK